MLFKVLCVFALCVVTSTTLDTLPAHTRSVIASETKRYRRLERTLEKKIGKVHRAQRRSASAIKEVVRTSQHELELLLEHSGSELERRLAGLSDTPGHALDTSSWLLGEARARLRELEQANGSRRGPLPNWLLRTLGNKAAWWRASRLGKKDTVADLSGSWKMQEKHAMDAFLRSMGFNALQRAAVTRAGQVQVIRRRGKNLHIVSRDIRGTSELVLPLGGKAVEGQGDDPDQPVSRCAFLDRDRAVVITETVRGESAPYSVCRRSLQPDGRLCVDVKKRAPNGEMVSMRIIYTQVDERGRVPTLSGRGEAAEEQECRGGPGGAGAGLFDYIYDMLTPAVLDNFLRRSGWRRR